MEFRFWHDQNLNGPDGFCRRDVAADGLMTHIHSHSHDGGMKLDHHHHDPSTPHPAQSIGWSVFRMALAGRLGAAMAVAVCLWAVVLLAMRAT